MDRRLLGPRAGRGRVAAAFGAVSLLLCATLDGAVRMTNAVAEPQLQDIKGPIDIRSPWAWVKVAAVLGLLGVLLGLAWWWWNRRRSPGTGAPGISPADRARQRLTASLDLMHDPERFATRVSEIVRTYLEERFGLRAPERTTEEFLAELTTSVALESRHKTLLAEFLTRCDLAKFARADPGPAELGELHDSACRLVEETAPAVPAAVPPVANPRGGGS